jgi:prefoldin subunit 5
MLCPMRLSDVVRESKPLAIDFGGGAVLNVEYRVAGMSLNKISAMIDSAVEATKASNENLDENASEVDKIEATKKRLSTVQSTLIGQLLETLVSWDLTENDGETVIPLTADAFLDIDVEILKKVQTSIAEDQKATGGK